MITLTVTESEEQIIYGIPYYLSTSSSDGIIFYTLDGSTPTRTSLSSDGKIYLPTNDPSFSVKILAISDTGSSDLYEKSFSASAASINNTRWGNEGGVVVMTQSSESANSMAYNSDGNPAKESSIDFNDLEIVATRGVKFSQFSGGKTDIDFINFSIPKEEIDGAFKTSVVNSNINFDPKSKVIIINATNEEEISNQSVLIINRPYDNFSPSSKYYVENESIFEQIISGNLVKSVYNASTGSITSYYYESKESRWIISNQKIEPKSLNLSGGRVKNFVYKWIQDPVMSKIY